MEVQELCILIFWLRHTQELCHDGRVGFIEVSLYVVW